MAVKALRPEDRPGSVRPMLCGDYSRSFRGRRLTRGASWMHTTYSRGIRTGIRPVPPAFENMMKDSEPTGRSLVSGRAFMQGLGVWIDVVLCRRACLRSAGLAAGSMFQE